MSLMAGGAVALARLSERLAQELADIVKAALRKSLVIVAQIGREQIADLAQVASIEVRGPFQQGRADVCLRLIAGLRGRQRTGKCRCNKRRS